jgi:spoIIIJ-associated protein
VNPEVVALGKRRLEELISFFGLNVDVEASKTEEGLVLNIISAETGRLIGHHGETLRSIQYLVNMMLKDHMTERTRVIVDVAGYRQAHAEGLKHLAEQAATKVLETGQEEELRPMNAADRRLVHMAVADNPEIMTESRGEEPRRRIVIQKRG